MPSVVDNYVQQTFKYIIIGDAGVGKSCLLYRYVNQGFTTNSQHTIGVEFSAKTVEINGTKIKLQLWDTAGQERFRTVTRTYYRGAAGAFIVYDITKKLTFDHIKTWFVDTVAVTPDALMVLIGHKSDLDDDREVSYEEAKSFADENGMQFIECSAKSGANVDMAFTSLTQKIYERKLEQNPTTNNEQVGMRAIQQRNTVFLNDQGWDNSGNTFNHKSEKCSC